MPIAFLALISGQAVAADPLKLGVQTDGYTYYNRPGADQAEHDVDLKGCLTEAARVRSLDELLNGGSGVVGGLVASLLSSGVRPSAVENCMVVKGWRVVVLPDAEGAALANTIAQDIASRLRPWIGSSTPVGTIARYWRNDAADAATKRFELRPKGSAERLLSVRSLGDVSVDGGKRERPPKTVQAKPAALGEIVSPPAGFALIIFHVTGASASTGYNILLQRSTSSGGAAADDGRPNFFGVGRAYGKYDPQVGAWRAFTVPAGRWRISALNSGIQVVNFCLGSPAFELKEGDVVYGGAFDLAATRLGPDLQMEEVKRSLASRPAIADRIVPAAYSNGWTTDCLGNSIYALEIPSAPFKPGYRWGSIAVRAGAP